MHPLDPVIHAEARLHVVATLAAVAPGDQMIFGRLQELLQMTAGNLSTHLRKLEDANYLEVIKTHRGRKPATYLSLTPTGRTAFALYRQNLAALIAGTGDDS